MGLEEHIGKEIEVEIGVIVNPYKKHLAIKYKRRKGILEEYEKETGYCRYSIDGVMRPPIHQDSIKLIYEDKSKPTDL